MHEPEASGIKNRWLVRQRRHGMDEWYLRRGPWKLIMDEAGFRLFDLRDDPGELKDVRPEHPRLASALASDLMARTPAFRRGTMQAPSLDETLSESEQLELEEALRSLGYID